MRRLPSVTGLGLVALLLGPPTSRADEPPPTPAPAPASKVEGTAALARAMTLYVRSMTLRRDGDYEAALPLAREVVVLRERVLGPEHPLLATALVEQGMLEQLLGARTEARALYERALAIQERAFGRQASLVAGTLNNLAILLVEQGDMQEARPCFERALAIWQRAIGNAAYPNVQQQVQYLVATCLSNLAGLLTGQGAYGEARAVLERALGIVEQELGPDSHLGAKVLTNLSVVLSAQGAYGEAQRVVERALAMQERVLGREHPDVATSLLGLAVLLHGMGSDAEARPLLERALAIQESALGQDHFMVGTTLLVLGIVLEDLGELGEVRRTLERALAIRERALGPEHADVAAAANCLAVFLRQQGALAEARPLQERALAILERARGPEHPDVATMMDNLAGLLSLQGELAPARALAERALAVRERALGAAHPDLALGVQNLATLLERQGALPEARALYQRALELNETHLREQLGGLSPRQRLALLRQARWHLDNWVLSRARAERSAHAEVLRLRGLASRLEAAERRLARRAGGDEQRLLADLQAAQHRLAGLAQEIPPPSRAAERAAWQRDYGEAGVARDRLASALAQRLAPLRGALERSALDLDAVRAHVAPGTVLVDLLRVEPIYVAWVVRAAGEPVRVDLGPAEPLEAACAAFVAALSAGETAQAQGQALRELVWTPLEAHLGADVARVVLCPDAALAAVPFGALPGRKAGTHLLDELGLAHVMCLQDLVPPTEATTPGQGALLVGGVDYDSAAAGEAAPGNAAPWPESVAVLDRAPRGGAFRALPHTRSEAEGVRRLLGGDATLLLGADASEARVREGVRGRRFVHVATHGFAREDLLRGLRRRQGKDEWTSADTERRLAAGHDPLLLSGLALAGANPREGGQGDDGILTALEVSYLDLDGCELVTLSACETAKGTAESGEGVQGLVSAFQMAGARNVIASLWKVDDEATRLLMEGLYERLLRKQAPLAPADALREAALALRDRVEPDGTRRFAAPRYWAAFVAYGR